MIPFPMLTLGQKVAAYALAALVIFISGAWTGGKLVGNYWKAKENARIAAEQAEYARLSGIAQELGQALARETVARQADARKARQEIDKWRNEGHVQVQCPEAGIRLVVPDAVHFGPDYVQLWNDSLRVGLPKTPDPGRPDDAGGKASPVTPSSLLTNVAENAESCNADRSRLTALQRYLTEVGK